MKISGAMGSQENNWMRQVGGYWSMAAAFVLQGALNEELFIQPAVSGEMVLIFAKIHPFLKELREKMGDPRMFENIEKVITGSKYRAGTAEVHAEASGNDARENGGG